MANYFSLFLDTTAPSNATISLEGGSQYAVQELVNATIGTTDSATSSYQMKIWGDVNPSFDTNIQGDEENSTWITYATTKQIKLSNGDGNKTVNVKIRDDVHNESAVVSDSILLDTTKPVVTVTNPDVGKISKIAGKNIASFSFTVDSEFTEYKVKVVSSSGASHDTGVVIPTTAGSTNMSGEGNFAKNAPIDCQINGVDLESASSGDGVKQIKLFVRDNAGNWSA